MPSLPAESYSHIFSVLQNLPIFDEKGKLKKEKDDVWNDAIIHLQNIKKHNLYIYVHQNRNSIQNNLRRKHDTVTSVQEIGISISKQSNEAADPFKILNNLHLLQYSVDLNAVIRRICLRPFTVMYCLPEQLDLWNELTKKRNSSLALIIMDGLIENVTIRNSPSKNVLLYALVTKIENNITLLYQAISEENTARFFNFFLRECLRNDFKAPSEFVCSYSYCLLDSVSKVFNGCSFEQYNLCCYDYLTTEDALLPYVLIRVDIFDLLKVIDE